MSSTSRQYKAVIPAIFANLPEVQTLVFFLRGQCLLTNEGNDFHFPVEEWDGSEEYYLDLPDVGDDTPPEVTLLQRLIADGKICLMYESSWNSGDEYLEEKVVDLVALAETIPTLVLQEILAKRLGSE